MDYKDVWQTVYHILKFPPSLNSPADELILFWVCLHFYF